MAKITLQFPELYPPQLAFCRSEFFRTLYGGARGGGKSYAVRWKATQLAFMYPGINILILRRTLKELENNHLKEFKLMFKELIKNKNVSWSETKKTFTFDNGSNISFGYMATDADADQYQGQNIEVIFMDEATHFTEYMYMKLCECNRLSHNVDEKLGLQPRMYLTANPGGVGHMWVKRLFIDRKYRGKEKPEDYTFIPARVYDNKFIMENDPRYVEMLESLPDAERRAMLDGEWDSFEGQFFDEFDEELHTFNPNDTYLPLNLIRYRARDYGLDMTACYWIGVDENDTVWVYRELAKERLTVSKSGKMINEMTPPNEYIAKDICPPDMWNTNQQTGRSAADILMTECGQYPYKSNNNRELGWIYVKELMQINPKTKRPYLQISRACPKLIESLKMIQHDENKPNDCAKDPHDITHFPDALRYFAITYTLKPEAVAQAPTPREWKISDFALNEGAYEYVEEKEQTYDLGGFYL